LFEKNLRKKFRDLEEKEKEIVMSLPKPSFTHWDISLGF